MIRFQRFFSLVFILFLYVSMSAAERQLAFPDAQGFGRFATGGRYGTVYHVTNLNDSGAGSLRDAVNQPNRIVVFDVAGVINISSRIVFAKNLYVAGQTAPGEGVTVYGNGVSFSGASNSIIRYMRFRMGKGGDSGKDCAGIANGTNIIIDHCSFAWGLDETFSINPDGKGDLGDITLSNCIVGQGLLTHSAGGLMQADNITLYRNLYCDNSTRNNKVKGKHQYVNNIVYNWSNGCYIMGGDSEGKSYANTTGNLFINGPSGGGTAMNGANADFHIYVNDNWQDKNKDGEFNPYQIPNSELGGGPTVMDTPYDYPELQEVLATSLIDNSLPTVGAYLPYRDYTDCYMVDEVMSFGKKGGLISTEAVLPYGVPSSWKVWKGEARVDSDGDGMPDAWETANDTDPQKDDAMSIANNGYANIENYINSLSRENRDFFLRAPLCLDAKESTQNSITISWADYTDNEEGFIIEQKEGNEWIAIGTTKGDSFCINNLPTAATAYTFRICAFSGESRSEYAQITGKTQPEQIDLIDITSFDSPYHDFEKGEDILLETNDELIKTIDEVVTPKNVVVLGKGKVTINGTGAINGNASMNKGGEGELTIATTNGYTGPTVLHEGTISFATLRNGGVESAIGASQEFGQNWVWNGGTWNYTGASTSTNRSANLLKPTRFSIDNANAEVKMSGKLQGNGSLIIGGYGKLTPSTSTFFSYNGETRLEGGKLYLNGVSTMWTDKQCHLGSKNKLVLAGGALETKDANDTYATYDFDIETIKETYSSLQFHRNCSIKSRVYGEGNIEMKVNYLREYITGNWDGFTGRLYVNSTTGKSGEQQLMLYNGNGIKNGVVELKGTNTQIVCWKASATYYLGGLSGDKGTYLSGFSKNTKTSNGTWIVGGAGTDETFNGVIDNRCSANNYNGVVNIVKEGNGLWRLNGNNVYSGTTNVNNGILEVNGKHSGTGTFTVKDGAILTGSGTIAGAVNVLSGATLSAANISMGNSATNTFTINGNLTMSTDSRILFPICFALGDDAVSNNSITLKNADINGATLELDFTGVETDLEPDMEIQLFKLSTTLTGQFTQIIPAAPAGDLDWDTTELYTKGILKTARKSTGINSIEADKVKNKNTYNLKGQRVDDDFKGIVIQKGKAFRRIL